MIRHLTAKRTSVGALVLTLAATAVAPLLACDDGDSPDSEAAPQADPAAPADPADPADTADPASQADPAPKTILADGEEWFGEGVSKFAEVQLEGTRLLFLRLPVGDGGALTLLEEQKPGSFGIGQEPELRDASLLDVFLAATEPDAAIPEELRGLEDHRLGARGWLADKAARGAYPVARASCVDSTVKTYLRDLYPDIDDVEDWHLLNTTPTSTSADWNGPHLPDLDGVPCGGTCLSKWYDHLSGSTLYDVYNVDDHKQRIVNCAIAERDTIMVGGISYPHFGPRVFFIYRTENNAEVHYAWSKDMAASDVGTHWLTHWYGSPTQGFNDFDWKIAVENAVEGDLYDIGYISNNNGW